MADKAGNQSSTAVGNTSPPWLEYKNRLSEAWKKPPRQETALAFLIRSDVPIKDVATVLRRECQRRRVGRPRRGLRWESPHYVVAYVVNKWSSHAKRRTNELITHRIEAINCWAFMRGKTPLDPEPGSRDHERVKTLLRRFEAPAPVSTTATRSDLN